MKFNSRDIKVVWLDLDDTVIDFLTNSRLALERLWREEPIINSHFATPGLWVETYERHNHALWDAYARAEVTRPYLRLQRFRLPLMEGGASDTDATAAARIFDTLYLDHLADERTLVPGALDLLKWLRSQDVIIGCLSNGFKEVQFRKIANCGLEPYFDLVVLSDDIDVTKPALPLYRHAGERSGFTDPAAHLMIGDNAATDIAGAVNAGWQAIHFLPSASCTPSTLTPHIVTRLDAIRPLIEANP